MKSTPPFPFRSDDFMGSFNGLVCFYGSEEDYTSPMSYCVCNLVTRECVVLPNVIKKDPDVHCSSGFGYLPVTNEYKVVQLYRSTSDPDITNVVVYTLGNGKGWRNVGSFDSKFGKASVEYIVFAKGSMHWLDSDSRMVLVFDLTEERFSERLSPPPMREDGIWFDDSVGQFGGVLYYARGRYARGGARDLSIWLLQEKSDNIDAKEEVEHAPLGWRNFGVLERTPLTFTKSGGVVCFDIDDLGIYDLTTSTFKKLVGISTLSEVIPHKNTLVSLKELGEEDIRIMEFAEIKETKSESD